MKSRAKMPIISNLNPMLSYKNTKHACRKGQKATTNIPSSAEKWKKII
jgi:hypothetical protein